MAWPPGTRLDQAKTEVLGDSEFATPRRSNPGLLLRDPWGPQPASLHKEDTLSNRVPIIAAAFRDDEPLR